MKQKIAIIGGGAAALMLAANLNENFYDVTLYDKNKTLGRKFLVAGNGGFNLTHSEPMAQFIQRYTPQSFLSKSLNNFNNFDFRKWLLQIGINTYIGSSKRIFPIKGIKPIHVLNAILKELSNKNVKVCTQYEWKGWKPNGELSFKFDGKLIAVQSDINIFALGGSSWAKTGSDGAWLSYFEKANIPTSPFQASNCEFNIEWPTHFLKHHEGLPLKNIVIISGNNERKGEVVITLNGLEGGALYALSPQIRQDLFNTGFANIFIDLKPNLKKSEIIRLISEQTNKSRTDVLSKFIKLNSIQLALIKEFLTKEEFLDNYILAEKIKKLPLQITGLAPLDQAISTVGGISLEAVDENFQLHQIPNNYVIGEMLNWDAPTGGYLLQGCFSMGKTLADHLNSLAAPMHFS